MTIRDEKLLAIVRQETCCWCGSLPPNDPHHIYAKGMGGGSRLDTTENVVPLCRDCHQKHHNGNEPTRADLIHENAKRLGRTSADVLRQIRCDLNKPKPIGCKPPKKQSEKQQRKKLERRVHRLRAELKVLERRLAT